MGRGIVPGVALATWLAMASLANAALITVDSTADDLNLGTTGNCTLREAIQAANTDAAVDGCASGSGADTVVIPAGTYTLTIPGANEDANETGDLDLTSDVTLVGESAGTTLLQAGSSLATPRVDRVVHALGARSIELRDLTIQLGTPPGDGSTLPSYSGGGILDDGADLTLERVRVRSNSSVISYSIVSFTFGSGGGIAHASGHLELVDSTVESNYGGYGGGLWVGSGTAHLLRTRVSSNTGTDAGGGLFVDAGARLDVEQSSVVRNVANIYPCWWWPDACGYTSFGGGLFSEGTASIRNSLFAWNQAFWSVLPNGWEPNNGVEIWANDLRLQWSTVVVDPTIDPLFVSATVSAAYPGTAVLESSILAGGCTGSVASEGWNLADSATCGLTAPSDLANVQIGLGDLELEPDGSYTVPLLPWSPAIDSGDDATCPPTDVLGAARPIDGNGDGEARCDRGANETEFHQNGGCGLDPEPTSAPTNLAGLMVTFAVVRKRRGTRPGRV